MNLHKLSFCVPQLNERHRHHLCLSTPQLSLCIYICQLLMIDASHWLKFFISFVSEAVIFEPGILISKGRK